MANSTTLDVAGQQVNVTNLQKVFYPKTGFTEGQVIDYYIKISTGAPATSQKSAHQPEKIP